MNKSLLGLSLIAIFLPSVSLAEGLYIGASVSSTEVNLSDSNHELIAKRYPSIDGKDKGFKAIVGYRAFKYLALEAFYVDLGEVTASRLIPAGVHTLTISTKSVGVVALGIIPVTDKLEFFVKLGAHDMKTEFRSTYRINEEKEGVDLTYGAGVSYALGPVSLRAEVDRYELGRDSVDALSAGFVFNF